jgi:hypothetical protein
MARWLAAILGTLTILTGCSASHSSVERSQPVTPAEWKSVIRDAYDGKMNHRHRCRAIQLAIQHLPIDALGGVPRILRAYRSDVCLARKLATWL